LLWLFAVLLTLAVLAALFLAMRRPTLVAQGDAPARAFFRSQLAGIDEDLRIGRISENEAGAARAELAREVLRFEREAKDAPGQSGINRPVLFALPLIAVVAFGVYFAIGRADLPAQPLDGRVLTAQGSQLSLEEAVAQVEARLVDTPNDVRGWQALGPVYMQQERYTEAANAFRRILDLQPPDADTETDLAEALILANGGTVDEEAFRVLRAAAGRDPMHVRSRFYLAGELTRGGATDAASRSGDQGRLTVELTHVSISYSATHRGSFGCRPRAANTPTMGWNGGRRATDWEDKEPMTEVSEQRHHCEDGP
jgi:cytochrome c-type biogenesis protein CcmH